MFESEVVSRIILPERDGIIVELKVLHIEELCRYHFQLKLLG
jgi:hypothetical protein